MGTRVYIGRLSHDCRERDIEKFFKGYGRIREILIKNGFGFVEFEDYRDADDAVYELNGKELLGERVIVERARGPVRRNASYGASGSRRRSNWTDKVSVEKARGQPRGSDLWSSRSRSRRAPPRWQAGRNNRSYNPRYGPPTRTENRVIVENLSSRVSWQDLKDYMRQAGEVTYADAHKQRKNEGVVEFATFSDMKNALEKLDSTELNGRKIRLSEDRSKKRRSRTKSRSRSRSRTPSKSRSRSKSRSKSRSRSRSKSASRSSKNSRSRSRSKSKSKSPSRSPKESSPPAEDNERD